MTKIDNIIKSPMTKSHDFNNSGKKKKTMMKIIEILENSHGLYPKSISLQTDIGQSTTRNYLREMIKDGIVKQDYPRGPYNLVLKNGHGIKEPRIHNIRFLYHLRDGEIKENSTRELDFCNNLIRFSIKFHKNTQNAECIVSLSDKKTKKDLSLGEAILLIDIFASKIEKFTKSKVERGEIKITTAEFNYDFSSTKLEGITSITQNTLTCMERTYNKQKDLLRHEMKPKAVFSAKDLIGMVYGGSLISLSMRNQEALERKIEDIATMMRKNGKSLYNLQIEVGEMRNLLPRPTTKSNRRSL